MTANNNMLSFETAKEMAIVKWTYILNHPEEDSLEGLYSERPEFSELSTGCSFCERYLSQLRREASCPLFSEEYSKKSVSGCCEEYDNFLSARNSVEKIYWAEKMLERVQTAEENLGGIDSLRLTSIAGEQHEEAGSFICV